jgi:hypothetical protein
MMIQGREYSLIMGSDLERDGMFLELYEGTQPNGSPQAEYFYSDADGSFSLTVYDGAVPEPALEWLRNEGARRLPASDSTT